MRKAANVANQKFVEIVAAPRRGRLPATKTEVSESNSKNEVAKVKQEKHDKDDENSDDYGKYHIGLFLQ